MANRDLIHKPLTIGAPEEPGKDGKVPAAPQLNKFGVQNRAREIGGEGPVVPPPAIPTEPTRRSRSTPARTPRPTVQQDARGPAFRAAYFNKDVESTGAVNQRASSMKALRGDEGASDLKKIIIPPPMAPMS